MDNSKDNDLEVEIDLSSLNYAIDMSSTTIPSSWLDTSVMYGNVTISSSGSNYSSSIFTTPGLNGTSFTNGSSGLKVHGDSEFDGDVKIQGHSILKLLKSIEDRLAILQEPSPEKLEKYAALKKAYDHYKTLERLIGED